jgi:hypothetical protein
MKMKVILLLAMMAVAMLAVSVSAWGQEDAAQGDGGGGSVGVSDRGDPVIKPRAPKPGEKIEDRTPTIKARVFDRDSNLGRRNIRLLLDNRRVDFSYSRGKDLLTYTPDENLSLGKHVVRIRAVQHRNLGSAFMAQKAPRANSSWSFKIVKD